MENLIEAVTEPEVSKLEQEDMGLMRKNISFPLTE